MAVPTGTGARMPAEEGGPAKAGGGAGHAPERSRCVILFDVLKAVREGREVTKTRMMQRACLDWRCFKRYFDFLLERGFIAECNPGAGKYAVTERGEEMFRLPKEVVKLCVD